MATLGIDASEYQDQEPPWALCSFAIIRASIGYRTDARFPQHRAGLIAAGKPFVFYHALLKHNPINESDTHPPTQFDPVQQVDAFLQSVWAEDSSPIWVSDPLTIERGLNRVRTLVPRVWVDVEAPDIDAALLAGYLAEFRRRRPGVPIGIYTSRYMWQEWGGHGLIGPGHAEFAECPLWVAQYPSPPPAYPNGAPARLRIPDIWDRALIEQFRYKAGYLPGYAKDLDIDELRPPEASVITPNHIKLGPHHMQGGNTTGDWLKLVPTVAKFVGDLGASVEVQPGTLAMGRLVDDGLLDGQGFDVNRYIKQGADPVERAAAYIQLLRPFINSNPAIVVWEGPNEEIPESDDQAEAADPAVRARYDANRQRFMEWYADFAYAFAADLHALGKRAGIGSWASGTPRPEHNLWRFWTRALQATVDFGAVECLHDYAGKDVTGLLRCVYDNGEFERLGFAGVPQVITELGADVQGTGWRQLFANDIGECYRQLIRPWLDQVSPHPWFLGAAWYTDGGRGWENYDVSGTPIVSYLAGYQAPPQDAKEADTMHITKIQQAQYLADLDAAKTNLDRAQIRVATTREAIAALTPDDAPPAHWWDTWPVGIISPSRTLPTPTQLIYMRDASGTPLTGVTKRQNGMSARERQGDLFRVLDAPINGQMWWVRAEDLPVPPAG